MDVQPPLPNPQSPRRSSHQTVSPQSLQQRPQLQRTSGAPASNPSGPSYSSEPLQLGQIDLRHASQHGDGSARRQLDLTENHLKAVSARIGSSLDTVRHRIRERACDAEFSTALKDRWQQWSSTSTSSGKAAAGADAGADADADEEHEGTDASSTDVGSDNESADEDADRHRDRHTGRRRDRDGNAGGVEAHPASGEPDQPPQGHSIESSQRRRWQPRGSAAHDGKAWDEIRRAREALLADMDRSLPRAFRFDKTQTTAFSRRIKTRAVNSLDRPFSLPEIHQFIHGNAIAEVPPRTRPGPSSERNDPDRASSPVAEGLAGERHEASGPRTGRPPLVLQLSYFWSTPHIDFDDAEEEQEQEKQQQAQTGRPGTHAADEGFTRPPSLPRRQGDGPGGMRRSQTIEVRSDQNVSVILDAMLCWSDDQPERVGWRKRLARQALGDESDEVIEDYFGSPSDQGQGIDFDGQEPVCARFTGRKRTSDSCMVIEGRLYGGGIRAGDQPWEADYASLLSRHFPDADGRPQQPGDVATRFDELPAIRVGQPYWILHQGDCVHSFTLDCVRALRPEEQPSSVGAMPQGSPSNSVFPRVTWMAGPAVLRFISTDRDNVGIGHRILKGEGHAHYAFGSTSQAGVLGAERSKTKAWASHGTAKRKEGSALRTRYGKCTACQIRKAQIGILGGERVRIRRATRSRDGRKEHADVEEDEAATTLSGMDEHLVSVCPQCAVLMGVARLKRPPVPTESGQEQQQQQQQQDASPTEPDVAAEQLEIGGASRGDDGNEHGQDDDDDDDDDEDDDDGDHEPSDGAGRSKGRRARPTKKGKETKRKKKQKTESGDDTATAVRPANVPIEAIEIDWDALNADESRWNGWTIFPLY
ncbi:uncharacterized protein PFL1_00592 [Pseudozyma flocculosa PF-1]|uniref:Uncharacterized protein n=1 Tax=Pseudozyma flocculosa TaxID=84751 RepID=A0A5C3EU79_9BASI|nr:uncharacterized protein PFL1_00592 [Pseudozyma flocculosa PF-1]EPQ32396.1 hypothetical protein PFL1_00592 [Pseudozyma flocculosa PF-1]SPO34629.1 uncharacterized protein PSFLO_00100 [Pseudozyma flocculosa]